MRMSFHRLGVLALLALLSPLASAGLRAQEGDTPATVRGSLVEDRAARKLIEAGDARYGADELAKAVEIWNSVIERYPRSRLRYTAHMRLGNHYLQRERAYDRARGHFNAAAAEENRDEDQRAEATLKMGICFYEARNYGKCFKIMRSVIEEFPVSQHVNQAYYYIGLGHFQLAHYSRAIDALQKVGTAFSEEDQQVEKVEAGKRLFVKVEDADLAALEQGETVKVRCRTTQGDEETVVCYPVGRNVRLVLGSIVTELGSPRPGNGTLEVRGDDHVDVTYIDAHTADRTFDRPVARQIAVVGNGLVAMTDGAFNETLRGVVLGREVNVQITDADRDVSEEADKISAVVAVYREKTQEEIDAETAKAAAEALESGNELPEGQSPEIDRYKEIDRVEITLTEAVVERRLPGSAELDSGAEPPQTPPASAPPAAAPQESPEGTPPSEQPAKETPETSTASSGVHSGVFRFVVPLANAEEPTAGDDVLQGRVGDQVRVFYLDERNRGSGSRPLMAMAQCVEGNLGVVRVTRTEISDQELLVKTKLKTASALTNIGNRYKEFGLQRNAEAKYAEALETCEEITDLARRLGGRLLEETYVQLWRIYYEMDRLALAAAMAQRLQREFPDSAYVDEALLQLADVARKQGDFSRAVGIYQRLVAMQTSQLRGEAQFGIAQCYEEMAKAREDTAAAQLFDRAFQEYKKVFDQFPDSGRVGEAVAKMANYYYQQQDYARAIDTFETVLQDHPDEQYLDVILFNYGRCLYKMKRLPEAKRQFDQLISDFPESRLATDAKRISEALARVSSGG